MKGGAIIHKQTHAVYLTKQAARNKRLRVKRAILDMCLDCKEDAELNRSRCKKHLQLHAMWSRSYWHTTRKAKRLSLKSNSS